MTNTNATFWNRETLSEQFASLIQSFPPGTSMSRSRQFKQLTRLKLNSVRLPE